MSAVNPTSQAPQPSTNHPTVQHLIQWSRRAWPWVKTAHQWFFTLLVILFIIILFAAWVSTLFGNFGNGLAFFIMFAVYLGAWYIATLPEIVAAELLAAGIHAVTSEDESVTVGPTALGVLKGWVRFVANAITFFIIFVATAIYLLDVGKGFGLFVVGLILSVFLGHVAATREDTDSEWAKKFARAILVGCVVSIVVRLLPDEVGDFAKWAAAHSKAIGLVTAFTVFFGIAFLGGLIERRWKTITAPVRLVVWVLNPKRFAILLLWLSAMAVLGTAGYAAYLAWTDPDQLITLVGDAKKQVKEVETKSQQEGVKLPFVSETVVIEDIDLSTLPQSICKPELRVGEWYYWSATGSVQLIREDRPNPTSPITDLENGGVTTNVASAKTLPYQHQRGEEYTHYVAILVNGQPTRPDLRATVATQVKRVNSKNCVNIDINKPEKIIVFEKDVKIKGVVGNATLHFQPKKRD
jgi:hypothetical protein